MLFLETIGLCLPEIRDLQLTGCNLTLQRESCTGQWAQQYVLLVPGWLKGAFTEHKSQKASLQCLAVWHVFFHHQLPPGKMRARTVLCLQANKEVVRLLLSRSQHWTSILRGNHLSQGAGISLYNPSLGFDSGSRLGNWLKELLWSALNLQRAQDLPASWKVP